MVSEIFISRYVSIGKMIASIVVAIYKVYLLITAKSIAWFAFSNSLSYIVISIMIYIFYQNQKGPKLSIKLSTGIEMLKESYHFILSGIMAAAYGQMDRIMIGQMMTNADVGLYTTATAICSMWIFVPNAIINSFRPTIMEVKKNGNEHLYKIRLEQLYSGIMWFCFGVSLVICICAPIVIKILYGQAYLGATNALRIAIWYEAFAMIGTARGIWILCEKKNKYVKYYLSIGAGINLVLNYTMIPYMGIEGAAMATLVTQITTSLFAPLLFKETRIHTKIVLEAFCFKWYFEKRKEG
ncbi:flippase [Coprococcus sp. AF21-14LB]|nr:flippase [Coprococcus sp. AF21-14LB]RGS75187.1 flippase [Coprococcus sp. AF21-14LB]